MEVKYQVHSDDLGTLVDILADARFEVTIPTVGVRAENGAIRTVISWIGTTWGKYHVN